MLYHMRDLGAAAFTPMRWAAGATQHVFTHPAMPVAWTRFGRAVAAGSELVQRTTQSYARPDWRLDHTVIDGQQVPVVPETVLRGDFCTLRRFRRETARRDPKVLLVAPLSGHFPTLLRGTVEALLPEHDVHVTDWTDAREVPAMRGAFDLDDYIDLVIRFLHEMGPDTHLIAVSTLR